MSQDTLPLPELATPPPPRRRVFCARNLRMEGIALVGFDLDYTLAVYVQEEMDRLSIETTARMLVDRGYPDELATMDFRTDFPIRGLLVDKRLGNVLKMDRYRYVKKAFHGMTEIEADERRALYSGRRLRPGTARYHWVDSLYTLSEVALFAAAVEVLDRSDANIDYRRLFEDIRASIAHVDEVTRGQGQVIPSTKLQVITATCAAIDNLAALAAL